MTALAVSYDARCGLCCAVAAWLDRQPKLVPLTCRPASGDAEELIRRADVAMYAAWPPPAPLAPRARATRSRRR